MENAGKQKLSVEALQHSVCTGAGLCGGCSMGMWPLLQSMGRNGSLGFAGVLNSASGLSSSEHCAGFSHKAFYTGLVCEQNQGFKLTI